MIVEADRRGGNTVEADRRGGNPRKSTSKKQVHPHSSAYITNYNRK